MHDDWCLQIRINIFALTEHLIILLTSWSFCFLSQLASTFFMIASFIDTDGDGQLSMDELKEFWAKIQSKLPSTSGPTKTDETQ